MALFKKRGVNHGFGQVYGRRNSDDPYYPDRITYLEYALVIILFLFAILAIILMFKPLAFAEKDEIFGNVTARFVKNYDGDTITVNIPDWPPVIGKEISVRIYGIDTPEKRDKDPEIKEMARTAQRLVENLCKRASSLELKSIRRDKYFRILADVYVDGKSVADLLIKNNLAKIYDGGTKNVWTADDYKKYQNTNH